MTVEQQYNLLMGIDPYQLERVKEAGEAQLKLYNFLNRLCEEPPQAVSEELKRRAKANAAKADLAERERRAKKAPKKPALPCRSIGVRFALNKQTLTERVQCDAMCQEET